MGDQSNAPKFSLARALSRLREFLILVAEHFVSHGGPRNASALTYTTLLSLVPLMTVSFAIFSAFPVADKVNELIQGFVFENFVPTSGVQLQQYLSDFSAKASQLTGAGSVFLVIVALLMMSTIDESLNNIWEVKSTRSFGSKFLIYWTVLSLGPILIGVSLLVTSYAVSLPILSEAASSGVGRRLLGLTPVLTSAAAFTLMYAVIPNRRVRLEHALVGGVFAACLFEVAKHAFAYYITQFPTYEAIYGALAVIPIFLVWVYLSWMIVLLGAEVTHAMGIFNWLGNDGTCKRLGMGDAVNVILALDEAAAAGEAPTTAQLARLRARWREPRLDDLLSELAAHHWVHLTREGGWTLARRLDDSTLMGLFESRMFSLPREGDSDWPANERLADALRAANTGIHGALDVPLGEFRLRRAESIPLQRSAQSERD
ncbi:virulence factor BrkB family protein [Thiosocius teredinicola]|uniref:virulence factor BrkB family protein n=1 Tax=Thiosocius teredinicola TaxID=1973002 RepID=UPI0009911564